MLIVIEHDGSAGEFDLQVDDPAACVEDLLAAFGSTSAGAGVVLDGRFFGAQAGLDEVGVYDGAVLSVAVSPPEALAPPVAGPVVAVVGGPCAGALQPVGEGLVVGRDPACDLCLEDPTVSPRHAAFEVRGEHVVVRDLGSRNKTYLETAEVDGPWSVPPGAVVRLGATQLRVLGGLPADRPVGTGAGEEEGSGRVPFNRRPRRPPPQPAPGLVVPVPPSDVARAATLSVVSILAPLLIGAVLLPRYGVGGAVFLLLSPVMAVGNWWSSRHRAKSERRRTSRSFRAALAGFHKALVSAVVAERSRRNEALCDPAETVRRASGPSSRLWERRPGHPDFLRLRAGLGYVPWAPPLNLPGGQALPVEVEEVVARWRLLPNAPVEVDLSAGGVVGIVGDRPMALSLARSLVCQAAVHHGPADLGVVVLCGAGGEVDWDWAKWLPHVRDVAGSGLLVGAGRDAEALAEALVDDAERRLEEGRRLRVDDRDAPPRRTRLLVVDDPALIEGRRAPTRLLLGGTGGPAAGIVIAATEDQLPAVCTTVVETRDASGTMGLHGLREATVVEGFLVGGVDEATARRVARALARYDDPEIHDAGAALPALVRLVPLLGLDDLSASVIEARWAAAGPDPPPVVPIGVGEDGPVEIDLTADGPHGLVGGTTGSGKSELLRSLVVGLAAGAGPELLNFVLVDYKGGSAFDEAAGLPHVVGLVTDLDGHLGERALRALEAELRYREEFLRRAGSSSLAGYRSAGSAAGPLPRLVVIVDEFATVAAELPDFIDALVGIAQRGRSLGVHLILATQRPSGVVNANIKANTNLRVALRVTDPGESADIIDRGDAATISRATPGRAYLRLGHGEVVLFQSALSSAPTPAPDTAGLRLAPFTFGTRPAGRPARSEGETDLARIVAAIGEAHTRRGGTPPRQPWLPMLAEHVDLGAVLAHPDAPATAGIPFGLADDPDRQRQTPIGWVPADGHLGLFGMAGSGTTTTVLAVLRALAERHSPDDAHLYAIDFGARGLAPLAALPHTGAVVAANQTEARYRLIRYLRGELERRRALDPVALNATARIVVALDGAGTFLAETDDIEDAETAEDFRRLFTDGPALRLVFVLTAERPGALPIRFASLIAQRVFFRLADPADFTALGLRARDLPTFVPGRGVHGPSGLVVQVGDPGKDFTAVAAAWDGATTRPPARIGQLPEHVTLNELAGGAKLTPTPVELTVGIADTDLGPAVLSLGPGDHALIAGPPRSGKSTTLALIATLIRAADPATVLVGICDERSPLYATAALDAAGPLPDLAHIVAAAPGDPRRWFVLIDDAPLTDDPHGVLTAALRARRPDLHVIGAGRSDDFRGGYGHWSRTLRQSRNGILLQPNLTADGELLGTRLPRTLPIPLLPGRGFIVNAGVATLAQIAQP